jgi:hypothetical protein
MRKKVPPLLESSTDAHIYSRREKKKGDEKTGFHMFSLFFSQHLFISENTKVIVIS